MSLKLTFIFFILVIANWACKSESKTETEEMQQVSLEASAGSSSTLPQLPDEYFVEIYEAQELIKIFHDEKSYRESYCQQAHLKDRKLFISMGIGRLTNPKTGQPIARQMAQRAAALDARRWAGYGETWLNNNFDPPFGKINKFFNRPVTTINENVVGDSLFVFIATSIDLP